MPSLLHGIQESGDPSLAYIAAKELLVHGGDARDVEAIANLGLRLLRQTPTPADATAAWRRSRLLLEARLSAHAGALPHARDLFRTLLRELPNSVVITGWLGVASARLGDQQTAAEMLARLEAMSARDPNGLQFAWQAAVRANLPSAKAAQVRSLLERARQLGVPFGAFHAETVFGALRFDPTVRGFFEVS